MEHPHEVPPARAVRAREIVDDEVRATETHCDVQEEDTEVRLAAGEDVPPADARDVQRLGGAPVGVRLPRLGPQERGVDARCEPHRRRDAGERRPGPGDVAHGDSSRHGERCRRCLVLPLGGTDRCAVLGRCSEVPGRIEGELLGARCAAAEQLEEAELARPEPGASRGLAGGAES